MQTTKPIAVTNHYKYDNQSLERDNCGSIFEQVILDTPLTW